MNGKGKHLQIVPTSGVIIPFPSTASIEQTQIVYLRSMLKCNTMQLAEQRKKLVEMQKEFNKMRRGTALRAVTDENQGSDPNKKV